MEQSNLEEGLDSSLAPKEAASRCRSESALVDLDPGMGHKPTGVVKHQGSRQH